MCILITIFAIMLQIYMNEWMDSQMMSLPLYFVFSLFNTCLEFPNIFFQISVKNLKISQLFRLWTVDCMYGGCFER
jgi:hypothetical protein